MINLKPFYDAVQAASTEVLKVANEIESAFALGTEEGLQQAMALKSTLDENEAKAAKANELYQAMVKAANTGEAAAKFVPVASAGEKPAVKKTITRAEYEAMDHPSRYQFLMKDGGTVVDELPQE